MNNISIDIYNEGAPKTPLVCLHGFLETKEMWRDLHLLFVDRPIICIDLPGHGQSEIEESIQCGFETMAKMVDELVSRLEISKYDIIGHSMGGYLTLALLEKFPAKVNKCILLNSNFLEDSAQKKEDRLRSLSILSKRPSLYFKKAFEQLFYEPEKHYQVINQLATIATHHSLFGLQYAIESMMNRKNQSNLLELNKGKVCMIQGEHDGMYMEPNRYSKMVPLDYWYTIQSSKHMSLIEQPTQTFEVILTWLEN